MLMFLNNHAWLLVLFSFCVFFCTSLFWQKKGRIYKCNHGNAIFKKKNKSLTKQEKAMEYSYITDDITAPILKEYNNDNNNTNVNGYNRNITKYIYKSQIPTIWYLIQTSLLIYHKHHYKPPPTLPSESQPNSFKWFNTW